MKALVLHDVKDLRYEEVRIPEVKEREVLIKVKAAGICGSDIPRVMKTGAHRYPIIIGHEFSGVVEKIGKEVEKVEEGDRVTAYPLIPCFKCDFCKVGKYNLCNNYTYLGSSTNGAFADYVAVPDFNVMKLGKTDFEGGAMVDPSSVALHAVRKLKPGIGNTVAVLGAGPIGLFAIQWFRLMGAKIIASDISDEKLKIAKDLGAGVCINDSDEDVVSVVKDLTGGVDGVIEAAGLERTINQSLKIVKKGGRISFFGIPHSIIKLEEKAFDNILRGELQLCGSWNSIPESVAHNDWRTSLEYMEKRLIHTKEIISHRESLQKGEEIFNRMRAREEFFSKVLFFPEENES